MLQSRLLRNKVEDKYLALVTLNGVNSCGVTASDGLECSEVRLPDACGKEHAILQLEFFTSSSKATGCILIKHAAAT